MGSRKISGRGLWVLSSTIAISGVALLAGYVGAYYWVVHPAEWTTSYGNVVVHNKVADYSELWNIAPPGAIRKVFAPIHAIDRRLRPHVWTPRPPTTRYPDEASEMPDLDGIDNQSDDLLDERDL